MPELTRPAGVERQKLKSVYREVKGLRFAFGDKSVPELHLMLRDKLHYLLITS